MHLPRLIALAFALTLSASTASAQGGGGVALSQYRAAPTPRDGLAVSRPVGLGHVGFGARLDVDYAYQPLRVDDGMGGEDVLVDHQLSGQLGLALGLLDRFVGHVRLPVIFVMDGPAAVAGDPVPSAVALGDVALGARWVLFGEDEDELFGVALATEATIPTAEAADASQDLAGSAGPTFTPEVDAELRFAPVRVRAEVGLRFRERAAYLDQSATFERLVVQHELTWGAGVDVDVVPGLLDATLEAFGATPLDDFADARRSPVEVLLGARLRPGAGLAIHAGVGAGLGDGYGAPRVRALLGVAWSSDLVEAPPRVDDEVLASDSPMAADPARDPMETRSAGPVHEIASDAVPAGAAPHRTVDVPAEYGNLDRDGDRLVDAYDQCPLDREDYDEIVDEDGCPETDADGDRVADVSDMCPLTPGVESRNASCNGCPERACVSEEGTITISERVEFETDSDAILDQSSGVLEDVRAIIGSSEQLRTIRIEGHTDDRDSDEHNLELSRSRAASVQRWLVERGLDGARFEAWGCGEAHPIEDNRSRRGRAANRRVEFHITDPPTAGYTPREGCVRADAAASAPAP